MEKKSIFSINIPIEYRSMVDDMMRMITLQFSANFLFYLSDSTQYAFFNQKFIKTILFVVIGIAFYWLIIRKIVTFNKSNEPDNLKFYYGSE